MNTFTSLKQNVSKIAAILLVLTQLVGCYAETGAKSKDRTANFDNEIVDVTGNTTTVSEAKTFSWAAPAAREDESPIAMSEIAGYRIYFGTETGNYTQSIEVNDAYIDTIKLDELNAAATYYIVVTTVDTEGRESAYSTESVLNV